jgi:hypothetical protein
MNLITLSKLQNVKQLDDYVKTSAKYGRLHIDNTNLQLSFATQRDNGDIHTLWFLNESKDKQLAGLYYMHSGSSVVVRYTEPIYKKLTFIHELMWLGRKADGRFDVFLNGKKVSDSIISYDMLTLGNELKLIQLNDSENVYLVLAVMTDLYKGLYIPRDLSDFIQWYEEFIHKFGYQGYLDDVYVSDIFKVQNEVQQCIFFQQRYKILYDTEEIYK